MLEKLEFKGYFNPPNKENEQLPGYLTFSQEDGVDLDIFGQFRGYFSPLQKEQKIIQGFSSTGEKITILNCYEYSRSMSFPGMPSSKISGRYLLRGHHFNRTEELKFKSLKFSLKDISHWIGITGFDNVKYTLETHEVDVKYRRPPKMIYPLDEKFELHIDFTYFGPPEFFTPRSKVTIEQKPILEIVSKNGLEHFNDFNAKLHSLLSFFSICYFGFPILEECKLIADEKDVEEDEGEKELKIDLNFVLGVELKKYSKHENKQDFLITFKDIEYSAQVILLKWHQLFRKIDASINILTEVFMYRTSPIELRFLSLAQAVENIYRRLRNNNAINKEEHKERIAQLHEAIKEKYGVWHHSAWLQELLNFSNEPRLQQRVEELIEAIPSNIRKALLKDKEQFIKRVKQNRNYYTHYDESLSKKAGGLDELYILSEKLKIVLLCLILNEVLEDKNLVEKMVLKKGVYLFNHLINYKEVKNIINNDL